MKHPGKTVRIFSLAVLMLVTFMVAVSFANEGSNVTDSGWVAPAEAKNVQNPVEATKSNIEKGKTIFAQQCAVCHGKSGKGDGPSAQYLGKPLPDFTGTKFSKQTDGEIFWKLSNGNAPMPTFKSILPEEQRWTMVNYLRTFAKKKKKILCSTNHLNGIHNFKERAYEPIAANDGLSFSNILFVSNFLRAAEPGNLPCRKT